MKKFASFTALSALSLLLMAGTALAAATAPATASGLSQFVDNTIQPVVLSVIGALTPLLMALGCRFLTKVTGINVSQASQQQLEGVAEKAVLSVEEKAAASLKTAGEAWTGYQKHQEAVDTILALAPSLTQGQADTLVHWAVAKIPGIGATGVLGATPASIGAATNINLGADNGAIAAVSVGDAAAVTG